MTVQHKADSDGLHIVEHMSDGANYTVHVEADHRGTPDISNHSYLLLPHSPASNATKRRMQRATIQTEWGSSEDERVEHVLPALSELGVRELLAAYEADRQDPRALQTSRMDCLHRAPLRKLSWYVRGGYQFDKFPVHKSSAER